MMIQRKIAALLCVMCLIFGAIGCGREKELIVMSEEEFFSYGETTELTAENWEEFFGLQPGPVLEEYNSGGTYTYQYMHLVPKEFCVISGEQAVLTVYGTRAVTEELYYVDNGELMQSFLIENQFWKELSIGDDKTAGTLELIQEEDFRIGYYSYGDSDGKVQCTSFLKDGEIKDLGCKEAAGTMLVFLLPEEVWNVDEDGVRYLCIGEEENYFRIYETTFYEDTRRYLKKTDKLGGGV